MSFLLLLRSRRWLDASPKSKKGEASYKLGGRDKGGGGKLDVVPDNVCSWAKSNGGGRVVPLPFSSRNASRGAFYGFPYVRRPAFCLLLKREMLVSLAYFPFPGIA